MVRLIGSGTNRPSTSATHAVLVGPPLGEAREEVDHLRRVRVEDVRPVGVGTGRRARRARRGRCRRRAGGGRSRARAGRAPRPCARAHTEPAKPAPTTSTSRGVESAGKGMSVHRDARVLAEEALAVGGDLNADPGAQLGVLAADGLGQAVADPRRLDVDRRPAGRAQALQQVGVLVPEHQRRVEELAGGVGELVDAPRASRKAPRGEVEPHRAVDRERERHGGAGVERGAQRRPPAGQRLDVVVHHDHVAGARGAQPGVDRRGEALRGSAVVDDHDLVGDLGARLDGGHAGAHALAGGVEGGDDDRQLGVLAGRAAGAAGARAGRGERLAARSRRACPAGERECERAEHALAGESRELRGAHVGGA